MKTPNPNQPAVPPSRPPSEAELDKALADTFPASDPVSLHRDTASARRTPGREETRSQDPVRPGEVCMDD